MNAVSLPFRSHIGAPLCGRSIRDEVMRQGSSQPTHPNLQRLHSRLSLELGLEASGYPPVSSCRYLLQTAAHTLADRSQQNADAPPRERILTIANGEG